MGLQLKVLKARALRRCDPLLESNRKLVNQCLEWERLIAWEWNGIGWTNELVETERKGIFGRKGIEVVGVRERKGGEVGARGSRRVKTDRRAVAASINTVSSFVKKMASFPLGYIFPPCFILSFFLSFFLVCEFFICNSLESEPKADLLLSFPSFD